MKPGRILAIIIGSLIAIAGAGLVLAGTVTAWAYNTQRDGEGYFTSGYQRIETTTAALHSEKIDLGSDARPTRWPFGSDGRLATVRIRAVAPDGSPLFVGIAHEADIDAYLSGVAHSEVTSIDFSHDTVRYAHVAGQATAPAPTTQTFWAASATGSEAQTLTWDVEGGRWAIVAMRPDGSAGVAADVSAGVKLKVLGPVIAALFVGGAAALALGTVLILIGAAGQSGAAGARPRHQAIADALAGSPGPQPVQLSGHLDEPLSRWLWLVKWFLAIPHVIVLVFLWISFVVLTAVAGVVILFTGRYPRSIFDFNVGVLRWTWRVQFYASHAIGTDRYPPFSLGAHPDYPATLDIAYPEQLSRGLVLVKWWLLALPHYAITAFFMGSASGGLVSLLVLIAGVVLLFTARYPAGLFDLSMGMNRWVYRVTAYAALMTDRYPPFRLDQGGDDPTATDGPQGGTPAPRATAMAPAEDTTGATRELTGTGAGR